MIFVLKEKTNKQSIKNKRVGFKEKKRSKSILIRLKIQ